MIPSYANEADDVYGFIKACDCPCMAVEKVPLDMLIKYINIKITGHALLDAPMSI
jgi:hypothetical protein